MNPHLTTMLVSAVDEVRELRARVADLEEANTSLRRQIVTLREAVYDLAEGKVPTLAGVGR